MSDIVWSDERREEWVLVGEYDACVDCYTASAGCDEPREYRPDRPVLGLVGDRDTADPGNSDHGEGFFSWRPCETCGSTLGGDRYPVVVGRWVSRPRRQG